jgi:hypothetical protein
MISRLLLTGLVILFLVGCKKKVSEKNLKNTSWKRTSVILGGVQTNIWVYPNRRTCELDNVEEFQENGVFQLKDIGEICSPNVSSSSTWEVSDGKLHLGSSVWTVDKFDDDELIIHNTVSDKISFQRYR